MDPQESSPPVGLRSSRLGSPGGWAAARSTRPARQARASRERRNGSSTAGWRPTAAARPPVVERESGPRPAAPTIPDAWLLLGLVVLFLGGEAIQFALGLRLGI